MKHFTTRILLILAGILLLAAYQPVQAADSELAGTSWTLSSLNSRLPLPNTTVTLDLAADGTASGTDGCNRFSTTYTVNGDTIRFRPFGATTMMACAPAVAEQAVAYQKALAVADKFEVRSNLLLLFDGSDVIATFISAQQELANSQWQVLAYNNGRNAVVSLLLGTEISANFEDDNQVSGNAGCNDYFGDFESQEAGAITVGSLGSTFRFCERPAGVMEQEAQYLAALQSAATYKVEGNFLEMRDGKDAIAVQLTRSLDIEAPEAKPGVPTGRVTAPNGVNVRSGPGTNFPVLGTARFGLEGEIIGRSANSRWWVVAVPSAPGGSGWVSADFVAVTDAADVPIIASPAPPVVIAPPTPAPTPTRVPSPTATPSPQLSFRATQTTIDQGQCTTLEWSVENVQAVWVYPQGSSYQQFPRVGQGSEQVCPPTTTTYEMRVLQRDGTTVFQRVTVTVRPAAPQNPLSGTSWNVTGYYTGSGAVAGPLSGTTLTTRFDASQISGNAGCNSFSGGYSVSGSNISIGALGTGMSLCDSPSGVMEQESAFLAALRSSATFQFDGNQLTLRRSDGTITAFMSRLQ